MKEVKTQILWTFEIGFQEGNNVPLWIIVGFRKRERQDSQKLNIDTLYRPPLTSAQCILGTGKYPDSAFF